MQSITGTHCSVCSQLQVLTAVYVVNYRYTLQCVQSITGTHCSVYSQLQVHTAVNYTHSFVNLTQGIRKAKEINQSLSTLRTTKQNQTTVHFQLILKNNMHMLVHKTYYMILCSVNTELRYSHSNNINHHRIPQMIPAELQIFNAVVSFTIFHTAVVVLAHI